MSNCHATFSRAVANLYRIAEHASYDDCPVLALNAVRLLVSCDVAVLGAIHRDGSEAAISLIAHSKGSADCVEVDALLVAIRSEPVMASLCQGIAFPLHSYLASAIRDEIAGHLRHMKVPSRGLPDSPLHLLAIGEGDKARHGAMRWIALCRNRPGAFTNDDCLILRDIWRHLLRSMDLNRRLIMLEESREGSASALINHEGLVVSADPNFGELIRMEWGGFNGCILPPELMACLGGASTLYHGRLLSARLSVGSSYAVCHLSRHTSLERLSRSEIVVAEKFASGASHKTIARELGISPHTVRNQIAQLYSKLGIHNKAELVRHVLASKGGDIDPLRTTGLRF